MADLFTSPDALRSVFADGLANLAAGGGAGSLILAVANARFDPLLWPRLKEPLAARFAALAAEYRALLANGQPLSDAPDDVEVFLKLALMGVEELAPPAQRRAGPWEVQCNPLRALRPPRMSSVRSPGLLRPFDSAAFHFNKPFMAAEALWEGELLGRPLTLYYNKFPFAPLHGLWVPERKACRPQFLDRAMHGHLWGAVALLSPRLPGIGFGYNALGAGASVNHLHFQMFLRPEPLPVESSRWLHQGGNEPYPTAVYRFGDEDAAWDAVEALHAEECPYNLLYRPGHAYLLPQTNRADGSLPAWCGALSWYELSGAFVTFSRDTFDSLDAGELSALLLAKGSHG